MRQMMCEKIEFLHLCLVLLLPSEEMPQKQPIIARRRDLVLSITLVNTLLKVLMAENRLCRYRKTLYPPSSVAMLTNVSIQDRLC